MLRYETKVTADEQALLVAVQKVEYGEIFSPKITPGPIDVPVTISANAKDLLDLVRDGVTISILTVHGGEPVYAEVDQMIGSFRCRKKVKFPTV